MATFLKAFAVVLAMEGGFVDDKVDPGGRTKYGISQRQYPDLDITNLTLDDAHLIYLRDYWNPLSIGKIGDQRIALEVFEQAVHMGTTAAAEILQAAIFALGEDITIDGIIGPQTLNAVNKYSDKDALLKLLNINQYLYYARLIERKPKLVKYQRGWLKRVSFR